MLRLRLAHDGADVDAERFGCPALRSIPGDRMLDETAIYGDLETVAAGIEERRQLGVDLPIIGMPAGDAAAVEKTLGTLVS